MRSVLNILFILFAGAVHTVLGGKDAWTFPLVFDFGQAGQKTVYDAVKVVLPAKYSGKKGYGLAGKDMMAYQKDSSFFYDYLTGDGIRSAKRIDFRIFLKPGDHGDQQ